MVLLVVSSSRQEKRGCDADEGACADADEALHAARRCLQGANEDDGSPAAKATTGSDHLLL